jgi:hypothetical protein
MGYIGGAFGMHGQGIASPIDLVMGLASVDLGNETSSLDASHFGPSFMNLQRS